MTNRCQSLKDLQEAIEEVVYLLHIHEMLLFDYFGCSDKLHELLVAVKDKREEAEPGFRELRPIDVGNNRHKRTKLYGDRE